MTPATTSPDALPDIERIALRSSPPPAAPPRPPAEKKPDQPRNRIGPPPASEPVKQGPDWVGYPSRALLPSTAIIAAVSTAWVMAVMPRLPEWWQSPEVYAAVPGPLVLFQLVRWLYRVTAGCYSLSASQLIRRIPGPIPDPEPIPLASVAAVAVEQTPAEKALLVGRLKLTFERDTRPPELLGPVGLPKKRAKVLEEAMAAARAGSVVSLRAAA